MKLPEASSSATSSPRSAKHVEPSRRIGRRVSANRRPGHKDTERDATSDARSFCRDGVWKWARGAEPRANVRKVAGMNFNPVPRCTGRQHAPPPALQSSGDGRAAFPVSPTNKIRACLRIPGARLCRLRPTAATSVVNDCGQYQAAAAGLRHSRAPIFRQALRRLVASWIGTHGGGSHNNGGKYHVLFWAMGKHRKALAH